MTLFLRWMTVGPLVPVEGKNGPLGNEWASIPCGKGWELKRPEIRTDTPLTHWPLEAGGCHTLNAGEQLDEVRGSR